MERILVVEDDQDSADVLSMLLRHWGYEVQACLTGQAAIDRAPAFKPQVVLVDLGLPVMDGYEVLVRLRSIRGLEGTRLIAVSGYGQASDVEHCRAAGFDGHLLKPVRAEVLRAALAGEA